MYTKGLVAGIVVSLLTIGGVVSWIVLHENRTPASLFTTITTNTEASVEVTGTSASDPTKTTETTTPFLVPNSNAELESTLKLGMTMLPSVVIPMELRDQGISNFNLDDIELSNGKVVYSIYDATTSEDLLFVDGKNVPSPNYLQQEYISGILIYITRDNKTGTVSLYSGGELIAQADSIDFENVSEKLLYTTYNEKIDTYTLYYDKELVTTLIGEEPYEYKLIGKKLAYATINKKTNESKLYYDGKVYSAGIGDLDFEAIGDKIAYKVTTEDDEGITKETLYFDSAVITTGATIVIDFKDVAGKLAYIASDQRSSSLYYDQKLIITKPHATNRDPSVEHIREYGEVGGKLAYTICSLIKIDKVESSRKCSVYLDGKLTNVDSIKTLSESLETNIYATTNTDKKGAKTLYYNGKLVSADVTQFLVTGGKLAYTECNYYEISDTDKHLTKSCSLYYDGKVIDSDKNITLSSITSKLVYIVENNKISTVYHDGTSTLTLGHVFNINDIGGNLLYLVRKPDDAPYTFSDRYNKEFLYFNDTLVVSAYELYSSMDYTYVTEKLNNYKNYEDINFYHKYDLYVKQLKSAWIIAKIIEPNPITGRFLLTPYYFKW